MELSQCDRDYLQKKATASVTLTGEKLNVFPAIPGTRQGFLPSSLLFSIILELLLLWDRQESDMTE